jgi:hypothetical protein
MDDDKETIDILDKLIARYRASGLKGIPSSLSDFGNPTLNFIFTEVYQTCINGQPILSLSGSGIFLEEFTNELWISSQLRKAQLQVKFDTWDEVMAYLQQKREEIESQIVFFGRDIKPFITNILNPTDLRSIELIRKFIRNSFIHSKRTIFIRTLQKEGVLPKTIPVGRMRIDTSRPVIDDVELPLTHPMISQIGFPVLAKQLAPALLIYSYDMFVKYEGNLGPLRDDKIKFPGKD